VTGSYVFDYTPKTYGALASDWALAHDRPRCNYVATRRLLLEFDGARGGCIHSGPPGKARSVTGKTGWHFTLAA